MKLNKWIRRKLYRLGIVKNASSIREDIQSIYRVIEIHFRDIEFLKTIKLGAEEIPTEKIVLTTPKKTRRSRRKPKKAE